MPRRTILPVLLALALFNAVAVAGERLPTAAQEATPGAGPGPVAGDRLHDDLAIHYP